MERINQFEIYSFGKTLRVLSAYKGGEVMPAAIFWDLWSAQTVLEALLEGRPFPIGISKSAAETVIKNIRFVIDTNFEQTDPSGTKLLFPAPKDVPVPSYNWDMLSQAIQRFETIFSEEMREAATYFVPRRGIYSTPALVDFADQTFPGDIKPFIQPKALEEWKSAGRCLAFNLLSASGFHVARAVEAVLESYYQLFCAKPGATLHGWFDYHKELKVVFDAGATPAPSEKTLAEIDQMRNDYRNPIMHPRVVLTESDARMLFANGESLIIAMAQEIKDFTQTGVQPPLGLLQGGVP